MNQPFLCCPMLTDTKALKTDVKRYPYSSSTWKQDKIETE